MKHYNIEIRKEEQGTAFFSLENLHQIYGLLVGQIDSFVLIFHDAKQFKRWWLSEGKKRQEKISHELFDHQKKVSFSIRKNT